MGELAILVPVLGRPHRVKPLLHSIQGATPHARVLFLADPDDAPECAAIRRERGRYSMRVDALAPGGSYASKIRVGVGETKEPLILLGADDLEFLPGWFEAAKAEIRTGAHVVGLNDLIPRKREHATHFLMTRDYAERPTIDNQPGPLHGGYQHWFCDDELIATAKRRKVYAYAPDAKVRHLHPMNGGEDDGTYRKGRRLARLDRRTFLRRQRLWR